MTVVAEMPSKSKSPNTRMWSPRRMAASSASAASDKPGDDVRVAPVAIERRREETVRGFRGVDAARDERGRDEVRHVQLALQACDRLGLCRLDVESGRHGGYLLIAVLSYSSLSIVAQLHGGAAGKCRGRRATWQAVRATRPDAAAEAHEKARPRDAVPAAAPAPYPLPRDAVPAAASAPAPFRRLRPVVTHSQPDRYRPVRSFFAAFRPYARSLAQACDNGAFLP